MAPKFCRLCGKTDGKPLGHNNHDIPDSGSAATCTAFGNTEYWICDQCGSYFASDDNDVVIGESDTILHPTGHIAGKGKYTGTAARAKYKINPKGTSITKLEKAKKAVSVKWKKQSARMSKSRITGYQIQLATNKKFTRNKKTVNVKGYKTVSKKSRN